MYYYKFGKIAIVGGRFDVTNVGSPTGQEYLKISMPSGITPVISVVIPAGKYYTMNEQNNLIVRVQSNYFQVVDDIDGNYSGDKIKTGYQGFEAVFMTA